MNGGTNQSIAITPLRAPHTTPRMKFCISYLKFCQKEEKATHSVDVVPQDSMNLTTSINRDSLFALRFGLSAELEIQCGYLYHSL